MDFDPLTYHLQQPELFDFSEATTGAVELFPAVWNAAENLTSPEKHQRKSALKQLAALNAPRLSPLMAYLVATRLNDPELSIRQEVVRILGEVLMPDAQGRPVPAPVYRHLAGYLAQIRERTVYGIVETAASSPRYEAHAARLLNACPVGGAYLVEILSERKNEMAVRKEAARLIAQVGYLDVLPVLQKMADRLETRLQGQVSMPFAPPSSPDETELLPAIRAALQTLKSA